ncbi:ABC transporter permease [Kocuria coralli]|uniref:ABC transporter permease n=1 Tax=Kocuria coralli TaxID=1461025 RepID=A0A5J5KWV3_9MICC|nr:ABC transporter permease [Kocuria coralli]KAA9393306.1 ABC transporter permease [Kocuria coralli]
MTWLPDNVDLVLRLTGTHLFQSVLPVVLGLLISIPLARLAAGSRWVRPLMVNGAALLYTIPSLTLFVVLPVVLGTRITSIVNVIVALTIYVVAILVRSCTDAFRSVDRSVLQAATAMGHTPWQRFWAVELPLAVPVMLAGVRTAVVANISMVSVGAVIGIQSLGTLFTDGLRRGIAEEILVGVVVTVVLAVGLDQILRLTGLVLTRWQRPGGRAGGRAGGRRRDPRGGRSDSAGTAGTGPAPDTTAGRIAATGGGA